MRYKYEIIALIVSWTSFLIWEYFVQQWISSKAETIIRVDWIIVLPALMMLTLWTIFKMKEEK